MANCPSSGKLFSDGADGASEETSERLTGMIESEVTEVLLQQGSS